MRIKEFAKFFVIFSLMNLLGAVVWAESKPGQVTDPVCGSVTDSKDSGTTSTSTTVKTGTKATSSEVCVPSATVKCE